MKQLLYFTSILILFFSPVRSLAQLNHFIYLQTENKQPFYVKMNKKILNSTISGYLIIPKLQDGNYNFSVGFLNTENKEYDFSCSVSHKDAGYLVKNFSDKGWGLFDLQNLQVVMSGTKEQDIVQISKTDAFSNLLSDVVNDPAIKQENQVTNADIANKVAKQGVMETSKLEPGLGIAVVDIKTTSPEDTVSTDVLRKPDVLSSITKKDILNNKEGLHVTYIDHVDGVKDTIIVFIPNEKGDNQNALSAGSKENEPVKNEEVLLQPLSDQIKKNDSLHTLSPNLSKPAGEVTEVLPATKSVKKEDDKKFLEIDLSDSGQSKADSSMIKKAAENSSGQLSNNALMINSDCKNNALEEDFLKLRKKMASSKSEEEMISSAKKTFKAKCFTTDQIKNLGVLFLNDAGRYNFFDVAYPFVSDTHNYKQLEDQLVDAYYRSRFQAMIRH